MAVHGKNTPNNTQTTQQAAQPQQPQPQQGYGAQPQGAQMNQQQQQAPQGFGSINSRLRRSGNYDRSEGRSAEILRALREAADEAVAAQGLTNDFELVRFDRDQHRVGLSSILVVKTVKNQGKTYCVVRSLLLDTDGIRLPPRVIQSGNFSNRIEVPTLPQDVYNDVYWSRIDEFMKRQKGVTDLKVCDAGPLLVPADLDVKDVEAISRILVTSVNHLDDTLGMILHEAPFSVQDFKGPNERLTARIDTTQGQIHDITNQPVRADLVVSMARQPNTQKPEEDFYEVETEFNSVAGFVNLEYTGQPQQQQMGNWGQPQQPEPMFTPTFVITSVDQADWIQAQTPELYLLAISNAFRVTAGSNWLRTFLPTVGKSGIDLKDIGALGYKAAGQKIETKSDSFTDQDFIEVMTRLVRPNPVFLIDVNPVGEHSGVENYFIEAAGNGPHKMQATNLLAKAANNLTGGLFSQYFDHTKTPIVVPTDQEIHLGYYVSTEDGEKHDLRDLDVLAMLNLTQGNMQDFDDWYRTYCDPSQPHELRMQRREQMERQFLSKGLKITGRAQRLLLTAEFIEALDNATRDAGVQVEFENISSVMGGQRFAGNTMINQYAVTRSASMGYGPTTQQYGGPTYGGVSGSGRVYS